MLQLRRQGRVKGEREVKVSVVKTIAPVKGGFDLGLTIKSEGDLDLLLGVELNLKFEVPTLVFDGGKINISHSEYLLKGRNRLEIADEILGVIVSIEGSHFEDIYLYPILTISQSEKGFDLVYQGSSIFLLAMLMGKNYRDLIRVRFKGGKNA